MGLTRFGVRSGDRLRYSYYNVVGGFFHLNKGQETNGYEAGDEDIMMKHFEGISLSARPVCCLLILASLHNFTKDSRSLHCNYWVTATTVSVG